MARTKDQDFGGTRFMGTGTYEAKTPEQARELRDKLPKGGRGEGRGSKIQDRDPRQQPHDFEPSRKDPKTCETCQKPKPDPIHKAAKGGFLAGLFGFGDSGDDEPDGDQDPDDGDDQDQDDRWGAGSGGDGRWGA